MTHAEAIAIVRTGTGVATARVDTIAVMVQTGTDVATTIAATTIAATRLHPMAASAPKEHADRRKELRRSTRPSPRE